ncbi:MAG: sporulation protein Cse60 [Bacilli bacterium]|nr:sporulation protein Cse60 [Bacilli bacterium]
MVIKVKVKLFDLEDEKDLEDSINDFLGDMEGELWDIKYQVSTSVSGEEQIYCFSAMIIYH